MNTYGTVSAWLDDSDTVSARPSLAMPRVIVEIPHLEAHISLSHATALRDSLTEAIDRVEEIYGVTS